MGVTYLKGESPFEHGFGANPVVLEQGGLKVPVPDPYEYEAQLLAMVFDHPPALRYPAVRLLEPAHWLDPAFGKVFGILQALEEEGIDFARLMPESEDDQPSAFRSNKRLASVVRTAVRDYAVADDGDWGRGVDRAITVASMGSAYPGTEKVHAEICAEKIREAFIIRNQLLAFAAWQARIMWHDPLVDVAKVTTELMTHLNTIRSDAPDSKTQTASDVLLPLVKDLPNRAPLSGTGFFRLDGSIGGGLERGRVYGLMAPAKAGKTAFAQSISHSLRIANQRHLFVALEMGRDAIALRELSRVMQINANRFRDPQFWRDNPQLRDEVEEKVLAMREGQDSLLLLDQKARSFPAIREAVEAATIVHQPEGFFLDYLQLVTKTDGRISTSEHIDQVAYWVSEFCRRFGVWAFVLIQTNQVDSIRGSEGPRHAFDVLWRLACAENSPDLGWLIVEASRVGQAGEIGSQTQPAYRRITACGPYWEEIPVELHYGNY